MFGLFKKKKKELSDEELNLQIQALEKEIEELDNTASIPTDSFGEMLSSVYQLMDKDKYKNGGKTKIPVNPIAQGDPYRNSHLLANAYGKVSNKIGEVKVGLTIFVDTEYVSIIELIKITDKELCFRMTPKSSLSEKIANVIRKTPLSIGKTVDLANLKYLKDDFDKSVQSAIKANEIR
jgi:hypothetical protein